MGEEIMKTSKILSSALAALFIAGIVTTTHVHAAGTVVVFAINGIVQKQGTSPLNIEGTYTVGGETIIIGPFGGNALLEYHETGDWLRMRNASITTSSAPISNVKFSFWRTFDSLNVPVPVTYSVSGSGFFTRSTVATDPKDWISLRGYIETTVLGSPTLSSPPPNPPTCTDALTSCATHQPATWTFNLNVPNGGFKVSHNFTSSNPPPPSADELKAEFWIYLHRNSDRLDISASPGIRVKFGPPAGEGDPECPKPVLFDPPIFNIIPFFDFFTPCDPIHPGLPCNEPIYPGSRYIPIQRERPDLIPQIHQEPSTELK
jgi:hypothetical protein